MNNSSCKLVTFKRPEISHLTLSLLVSAYVMAALNSGFWVRMVDIFGDTPWQLLLFSVAIFALTVLTLEFLGPSFLQKPVAAMIVLLSASANYYERTFGIVIDREMVRNIFETTTTESRHLFSLTGTLVIFLTGIVPAAIVFWPRVVRLRAIHQLWRWPLGVAVSFGILAGGLFLDLKTFSAVLRERKELMATYQPGATIAAFARYAKQQFKASTVEFEPIALDAKAGSLLGSAEKPVLMVIFVGETLRAQNFGLNGYTRQTTPELAKREVINFSDVDSCGTSTAVSVPCMFSSLSRESYSRDRFMAQGNLLDVLAQAGFAVRWVDNNTGDQHVAARTGWQRIDASLYPEECAFECTDEVFLPIIQETLAEIKGNTILVLHMIGNHGPAYFLRYPRERATFQPDCQSTEFSNCTVEEIVNAYDNAVVQTDHVLAQTIDMLSASDRAISSMLFVSDHGESLGENGLYLHAAPMFMAPETQTKVPMVLWMDPNFQALFGHDVRCILDKAAEPASHDNFFHTVLGLLNVITKTWEDELDLTSACTNKMPVVFEAKN